MVYNNWDQKKDVILAEGVNEIDFTTTAVTLTHSGDIKFRGKLNKPFEKPTMNLLPGNYKFKFKIGSTWTPWIPITVEGCEMGGTLANITLKDANGGGIEGGVATYTPSGSNWQGAGTTDANGNIYALVERSEEHTSELQSH